MSAPMVRSFCCLETDPDLENPILLVEGPWSDNLPWAAKEAGEYYHKTCGWEYVWPLTFVLLGDEGRELGRFSVDRELVPHFSACAVTEPAKTRARRAAAGEAAAQ